MVSYIYPTVLKSEIEAGVGGFYLKNLLDVESISNAGDVDGDGMDDLVIGSDAGVSYLVFGKNDGAPVDVNGLYAGIGGFVINGRAGNSVSNAGDVNQDGLDDVLLGDWSYDGYNGAAYLVYGKTDGSAVDLSDVEAGIGGFIMNGGSWPNEIVGMDVSHAGDVNSDGVDDLLIGAHSGPAYLVFGKGDTTPVDMSDIKAGNGGYLITGAWHSSGVKNPSVAYAGDVNGDGIGDHVFSARPSYQGGPTPGAVVAFGKNTKAPIKVGDIQAGIGGFFIEGTVDNYYTTISVSGAGDINGDGLDDVLVSDWFIDKSYVVFGKADGTPVDLADVESGTGGFLIDGTNDDRAGETLGSAGDFNGDGLADVIIGTNSGSYVVFGKSDGAPVYLTDVKKGIGGFFVDIVVNPNAGAPLINNGETGDFNGDGLPDLFIGNHVVFGGVQPLPAIVGTEGDDKPLAGTAGDDLMFGLGGNDVLVGGPGADALDGGTGTNTAKYSTAGTGVAASLIAPATNTGDAQGDTYTGIQNLEGSPFDDDLRGDNGVNGILAHGGNDTVYGFGGNDNLVGGDGNDFLIGGNGADTLNGGPGQDRAQYHQSSAGVMADLAWSNVNTGEAAGDTYIEIENLFGSNFDDHLRGDDLANQVSGHGGDDIIHGRDGADNLIGGDGDDFLIGGGGIDTYNGGNGYDRVQYQDMTVGLRADLQNPATNTAGAAGETYALIEGLVGSQGDDFLLGDAGANWLHGFDGDDRVYGRAGNDVLFGNSGNDALNGGAGDDILVGGPGIDTFIFDGADFGSARIADFGPGESIDLTAYPGLTFAGLSIVDVAGRAVVSFAAGEITMTGIPADDVMQGMFDFAP